MKEHLAMLQDLDENSRYAAAAFFDPGADTNARQASAAALMGQIRSV